MLPLITPGKPDQSALYKAITGTCADAKFIMPAGCTPGPGGGCVWDEDVATILKWITDGAKEK
jgi:hypothetical protein